MLIVFEGADATGKQTQAEMLARKLANEGINTTLIDFPDYNSVYGRMIKEYLKTGKKPVEETLLLYLIDQYAKKETIENKSKNGVVICDRYWYSNLAHQVVRPGGEKLKQWIINCASQMPKPDLVFLTYLNAKTSEMLMREKEKDSHELNIEYQIKVREKYLEVAQEMGWTILHCVKNGALRPPEDIHEEVIKKVREKM